MLKDKAIWKEIRKWIKEVKIPKIVKQCQMITIPKTNNPYPTCDQLIPIMMLSIRYKIIEYIYYKKWKEKIRESVDMNQIGFREGIETQVYVAKFMERINEIRAKK